MTDLRKVRVQLLDEATNEVIEEVDVITSATSVVFSDGETFQQKLDTGKLKGATGITGAQGPQGLQGPIGPQGPQGVKGDTGAKGDIGAPFAIYKTYVSIAAMNTDLVNVPIGSFVLISTTNVNDVDNSKLYLRATSAFTYINDLSGAQGIQGPAGIQGIQGPAGAQGPKGDTGLQGPQGIQGLTGPKGDTGATGPQGIAGPQGLKGDAGATGPQGGSGTSVTIKGTFTSTSQLPVAGTKGDSYIVLGDLYTWDGAAWNNVGRIQGPQGIQGIQGPTGATGAVGAKGATGATGATGPQGPKGDIGATGPAGDGVKIGTDLATATEYKLFFKIIG